MPSTAPVSALRRRFARLARLAVLIACSVVAVSCDSAIETVRSLQGLTKNDPDPATAPFTGNMAAAEAAPYPNLASVPPPPSRATTTAERQKLTEKLVAERTAAATRWAATGWAAAPAPPMPVAARTAGPAAPSESPPTPATLPAATPKRVATAGDPFGPRRAASGQPTEPLPRDSEVQPPRVRSVPEPEALRPAPAPARLPPVPAPSELPPLAIASATPQPPPPVPQLAPLAPPPAPSPTKPGLAKTEPPRSSGPATVAMLDTAEPGQLDPAQIARVAARYKERLSSTPPLRAVRVIAYTAMPAPGADPLGGYHDALERAQGIAKVLTEAGIPEKMIQTEAKPAAGPIAASRVEIQFLP